MSHATFPGFSWEGFLFQSSRALDDQRQLIRLEPDPSHFPRCGRCNHPCQQAHDTHRRRVRDANLLEYRAWIEVPVRRVVCLRCGVSREAPHLAAYPRTHHDTPAKLSRTVVKTAAYQTSRAAYRPALAHAKGHR